MCKTEEEKTLVREIVKRKRGLEDYHKLEVEGNKGVLYIVEYAFIQFYKLKKTLRGISLVSYTVTDDDKECGLFDDFFSKSDVDRLELCDKVMERLYGI